MLCGIQATGIFVDHDKGFPVHHIFIRRVFDWREWQQTTEARGRLCIPHIIVGSQNTGGPRFLYVTMEHWSEVISSDVGLDPLYRLTTKSLLKKMTFTLRLHPETLNWFLLWYDLECTRKGYCSIVGITVCTLLANGNAADTES